MIDEKLLIKELEKRAKLHEKDAEELNTENFSCDSEELFLRLADETCACIEVVEEQPQINAWIPCSERLPEKEGLYLVSVNVKDETDCKILWFSENFNSFTEYCRSSVAWMPLPEPYKGE